MTTANESEFDPRSYVDRDEHQEHLRLMIARQTNSRLLLISDVSGQGKSDLLLRLRLNCLESDPRASALLVDVRDLATPFSAVERAFHSDQNADAFADHLATFCQVYEDWSTRGRLSTDATAPVTILVEANNALVGANGSVIGQVVTAIPPGVGSREAQRQCLRAVEQDLRAARELPLVILIDHYNRAGRAVRSWVDEKLLGPCLLGELSDVIVVVASTPDFHPSYAAEFEQFITCWPLTRLEDDPARVEDLLRAHHLLIDDAPDRLVSVAVDSLSRGIRIGDVLGALQLLYPAVLGGR
jgi:hypothetical protein